MKVVSQKKKSLEEKREHDGGKWKVKKKILLTLLVQKHIISEVKQG